MELAEIIQANDLLAEKCKEGSVKTRYTFVTNTVVVSVLKVGKYQSILGCHLVNEKGQQQYPRDT